MLGPLQTRVVQQPSPIGLNLVVFLDVHVPAQTDPLQCGSLDLLHGFQQFLALLYALNLVNTNRALQLASSIQLGALVLDTCSSDVRVTQDVFSLITNTGLYDATLNKLFDFSSIIMYMPFGSANAAAATRLLSPRGVPTLSPSASTDNLRNTPYFLHTLQRDSAQARILAEVVSSFNWGYITLIYSENDFGETLKNAFIAESVMVNVRSPICIASIFSVSVDTDSVQAKLLLRSMDQVYGSNIVVLLTSAADTRLLLQSAQDLGYRDRFVWVGGTLWGRDMAVVTGLDEVARGAITIQHWDERYSGFVDYMTALDLNNHDPIPDDWFEEFWQHTLQCRLDNSTMPRNEYPVGCTRNGRLTPELIEQDELVMQTIISTYMVAQGLNDIQECTNHPLGMSSCLGQYSERNNMIYEAVKNAQWAVLPGELQSTFQFRFDKAGSGNTGYNIYNYRNGLSGDYEYVKVINKQY